MLLVGGAELLVSGAVHIAQRFGVSGLLIGLLVGLGTSTPELVTSVLASLAGTPGIALGNVVGANVSNMLLVLGACALVRPVRVDARSLRFDGGVVLGSLALFAVLSALVPSAARSGRSMSPCSPPTWRAPGRSSASGRGSTPPPTSAARPPPNSCRCRRSRAARPPGSCSPSAR